MTTMTRFTKEQLIEHAQKHIAHDAWLKENFSDAHKTPATVELVRIALAALTADPVRYLNKFSGTCVTLEQQPNAADDVAVYMPLYAAPPVQETGIYKDVLNIIGLLENNEWAEHCASTVLGSLLESEITRLVGKEQSAPVVPEGLRMALSNAGISAPESDEMLAVTHERYIQALVTWVRERKPFQPVPVVPETLPCPVHLVPGLHLGKGCKTETLLIALQRRAEYYAGLDAMTPEERAKHYANIEAFKAMLPQPAPVAPEDLRRSFEAVARLNNEMYRWTSCMSYNGSYVGEPEGLLKRNIREIERILDRCKNDKGE
ncbi:hypothetical protein ACFH92_001020 [Salmonella enterica]